MSLLWEIVVSSLHRCRQSEHYGGRDLGVALFADTWGSGTVTAGAEWDQQPHGFWYLPDGCRQRARRSRKTWSWTELGGLKLGCCSGRTVAGFKAKQ